MRARSLALVSLLTACGSSSASPGAESSADGGEDARPDATSSDSSVDVGVDTGTDAGSSMDAADGTSPSDAASDTSTDLDAGSCAFPDAFAPTVNRFVPGTITATIDDLTGAPVAGFFAILCGTDLCAGSVTTNGTGALTTTQTFAVDNPALRFGDSLAYPEFILPVTTAGESLGTLHTAAFPTTGVAFMPGTSVASGPLTLTLAAGGTAEVDTLNYSTPSEQLFRAVDLPIGMAPVDATVGLEIVIGTTPLETLFCPPVQASVPNSGGWAAGTAVDFYALGTDVSSYFAPWAGWAVISTGHVSADGASIATDPGAGLSVLTNLGIRRH